MTKNTRTAPIARSSLSRSSTRWEMNVSCVLALIWLFDDRRRVFLRRRNLGACRRAWRRRNLGFSGRRGRHLFAGRSLRRLIELGLGLVQLRLHRALDAGRRLLHRVAHLAQLLELDL